MVNGTKVWRARPQLPGHSFLGCARGVAVVVVALTMLIPTSVGATTSTSSFVLRASFFDIKLCGQAQISDSFGDGQLRASSNTRTRLTTGGDCDTGIYGTANNVMEAKAALLKWTGSVWAACAPGTYSGLSDGSSYIVSMMYADSGACSGVSGIYKSLGAHGGYVWGAWNATDSFPFSDSGWLSGTAD